jgi:hypothetical protein
VNAYSIFAAPDRAERRKVRRQGCAHDVEVRQQGRFSVAATIADATPQGCRVTGGGPFIPGFPMMVRMPREPGRTARIVWSEGRETGVRFERSLEPDAFARLLPARRRLQLVAAD